MIDAEKAAISTRNEYVSHELHRLGYQNPDQYRASKHSYKTEESVHRKYMDTLAAMQGMQEHLRSEIQEKLQNISPEDQKEVARESTELRNSKEEKQQKKEKEQERQ